ncbi:MAG TPA: transcription termination factor NusA [bacterium]|nr:transcription termination factor NusA [bacterium]HOL47618.1 transcription termination factor NusA [bacterium]HPQ19418.1 transcription termination factor NusA [bacterium]
MKPEELLEAVNLIEKEKNINRDAIFAILTDVLSQVYKKFYAPKKNIKIIIDKKTGVFSAYESKTIVENVKDSDKEISIQEALTIDSSAKIGDSLMFILEEVKFDRIVAQTVKQTLLQRIKEEEKKSIFSDVKNLLNTVITGEVQRIDKNNVYVNIGKTIAILPTKEQTKKDNYKIGDKLKFYIVQIENKPKGVSVILSRTHPKLVEKLFEEEITEIYDKLIEIKGVARDPGYRSKIAVKSLDANIDPIGTCVGQKGNKIQSIVKELKGEKIDIIPFSEDEGEFIINALRPAVIEKVILDFNQKVAKVIVQKEQLSLAIGKNGQNAKLAAKLTGWKIDIYTPEEYNELFKNSEQEIIEKTEENE